MALSKRKVASTKISTGILGEVLFPGVVVENFLDSHHVIKTNFRCLFEGVYYLIPQQTVVKIPADVNPFATNNYVYSFLVEVYFRSLCFELTQDMIHEKDELARKKYPISDCQLNEKARAEMFLTELLP